MSTSNTLFPMLFTLEHVENGYILTAKEESAGLSQEATYKKEVVAEDKINSRIGQLLHLDAMVKERPVVFHVEAVNKGTYDMGEKVLPDDNMEAKLAYVHFKSKDTDSEGIVVLLIKDTQCLEVYGADAEKLAKQNNLKLLRAGGIPFLRFPNTKEGNKLFYSYCPKLRLMEVTLAAIQEWYDSHRPSFEKKEN